MEKIRKIEDYHLWDKTKENDIKLLCSVSNLANKLKNKGNFELYQIYDYDMGYCEFSFHPNGNCGHLESNDDYIFGIRCNNLMWSEGWIEGVESFYSEDYDKDCILIYGNHKGTFVINLLVCKIK